jgi:hypothetical protein
MPSSPSAYHEGPSYYSIGRWDDTYLDLWVVIERVEGKELSVL